MEILEKTMIYKVKKAFARAKNIPIFFAAYPLEIRERAVYLYGNATIETTKTNYCMICGRTLTHPVSVVLGIGPECGGHWWNWNAIGGYSVENIERIKGEISNIKIDTWVPRSCILEITDSDEEVNVPEDHPIVLRKTNKEGPTRQAVQVKKAVFVDGKIKISFPYNPETVALVKMMPGRKFDKTNPKDIHWTVNYDSESVDLLRQNGFEIDQSLDFSSSEKMAEKRASIIRLSNKCTLFYVPAPIRQIIKEKMTFINPAYTGAVEHGRFGASTNIPKYLTFFEETPNKITFLRGALKQVVEILREHDIKYELKDHRSEGERTDITFNGELRDYQEEAVDALMKCHFGVLEAATGSGKTVIALGVIAKRKANTLILVHTKELMYQWQERVKTFLGVDTGLLGDGICEIKPVTIGMVKTVKNKIDNNVDFASKFGQLVVDECHRTPSSTFMDIVTKFPSKYMLGLSATAYRRDGLTKLIYASLGRKVHTIDNVHLRNTGAVLRPNIITKTTQFDFTFRGEYSKMLSAVASDVLRNKLIADTIKQLHSDNQVTLVTSDRVGHLKELSKLVGSSKSAILHSKTPMSVRHEIVEKVNQGKIKILFATYQLIGEGFDCAGLATLHLATPFRYTGRLVQVAGRVLRPGENKTATIVDYVDEKQGVLRSQAKERRTALQELKA